MTSPKSERVAEATTKEVVLRLGGKTLTRRDGALFGRRPCCKKRTKTNPRLKI